MGSFSGSERPIVGQRANKLKSQLLELITNRLNQLKKKETGVKIAPIFSVS